MKVKKGDQVIIIAGKDKGKTGEVIRVDRMKDKVVVDDANLIKRHIKSSKKGEKGQRIEMPAPIHISNVKFYCSQCKKGVRIGHEIKEGETKKRICKKCKHEI